MEIEEMPGTERADSNEKYTLKEFIARQFKTDTRSLVYLNGSGLHITGTYWFFIQCYNEEKYLQN
jgi:hypothetical protein